MAIAGKQRFTGGLVDLATAQISREIFVNEEIYQEELDRVFTRAWLFVGHESQIPKPGDFFVSCMGEESVILCRDREDRYSYEQGLGFEVENYEWDGLRFPGTVLDITDARSSEHNLRNFYRRWAEFMDAERWEDLATWRRREG